MGPFSTAVAAGALNALQWLLGGTALLLLAAILVQHLRGDEGAQPVPNLVLAAALGLSGFLCGLAARWLIRSSQRA